MTSSGASATTGAGPIPVTVLTGFLGSGKTTLLNRILSSDHGLKVGVIVNEFGAIGIDDRLITRASDGLVELSNGCVCCTMSGDLIKTMARFIEADVDIDYILIETTGLADPAPVAATLCYGQLGEWFRLDSIVTVVDAYNFDANLDRAEAAYAQLVNADILLINKVDLVGEQVPSLIESGIGKINPRGRFLRCVQADVDPCLLLDVDLFHLKAELANAGASKKDEAEHLPHVAGDSHGHLDAFQSVTCSEARPLDRERFSGFVDGLPAGVFRAKGIVNFAGTERRHIFHLVGDRSTITEDDGWAEGEVRRTDLVLIGSDLDDEAIRSSFHDCLLENA